MIDRFDSTPEPDEPLHNDELDLEPEEELYDEDQFYKEQDISPGPAPKLQGDLSKRPSSFDIPSTVVSTSVSPPQRTKDESAIEGNFY